MAVTRIWNLDWTDANRQRSFPITGQSSCADISGSIRIPDDFLVDLVFSVPHIQQGGTGRRSYLSPGLFHIKTLSVFSRGVIIALGYNGVSCGTATINAADNPRDKAYAISGTGIFQDARGTVVIGTLDTLYESVSLGSYSFSLAGARLEPATVKPTVRGISSVRVVNGRDVSEPMTGDIHLVAGRNIRFVVTGPNTVRIDAVASPSLLSTCQCDTIKEPTDPIMTINGIPPDEGGNFNLIPSACMDIVPEGEATLRFTDTCSEPCCDCEELEVLRSDITLVQQQANTVSGLVSKFDSELSQLRTSILGSRLAMGTGSGVAGVPPGEGS